MYQWPIMQKYKVGLKGSKNNLFKEVEKPLF